jgi:hypothetical protein
MRLAEEGGETCSDQTYDADAETSLVEQIFPVSVLFVPLDSGEQIRKHLQRQRLGTKAAELLEERPPVGTGVNGLAKDRGDEQQASKDDGPGRYGPVRIERVVMDNGEQRKDRGIYRNYAKRLDVARVVVARLPSSRAWARWMTSSAACWASLTAVRSTSRGGRTPLRVMVCALSGMEAAGIEPASVAAPKKHLQA